jgi:hypothetical protein
MSDYLAIENDGRSTKVHADEVSTETCSWPYEEVPMPEFPSLPCFKALVMATALRKALFALGGV